MVDSALWIIKSPIPRAESEVDGLHNPQWKCPPATSDIYPDPDWSVFVGAILY